MLSKLGLADTKLIPQAEDGRTKPRPKAKKRPAKVEQEPSRRSKRSRGAAPEYTGERIDKFGEELDAIAAGNKPKPAKPSVDVVIGAARDLMMESLARLAAQSKVSTSAEHSGDWFEAAVAQWGPRVRHVDVTDWEEYVKSRTPVPLPFNGPSPYMLLQEVFAGETWKLLVSCKLHARAPF